ncbi:DNA-binding response regulator [Fulvimarina endophytica]|uniref:DNA-binding response regulator n=1 Tax=Fulvimarina endophytica TaxID=2293836 RepID=A0A371X4R3_9HYPH|nr:response regulator transcription factor [Fulvimarina endophytica]RFC64197.1 DNA-binding response regulator [Fulvimarina endophytica]
MRILIVEDDEILGQGLEAGLAMSGFTTDWVETMGDADAALRTGAFAALVLDVMLPDGTGHDLLALMRGRGDRTPVLLLTALDSLSDRVRGLDGGADDHLGKPFELAEVAARLRALARRGGAHAAAVLSHGAIVLDPARLSATMAGRPVALSRREFSILHALMEHPGKIVSRLQLEDRIYGFSSGVESNAVEVHIHNLRQKFGRETIATVRGLGYRLGGEAP